MLSNLAFANMLQVFVFQIYYTSGRWYVNVLAANNKPVVILIHYDNTCV